MPDEVTEEVVGTQGEVTDAMLDEAAEGVSTKPEEVASDEPKSKEEPQASAPAEEPSEPAEEPAEEELDNVAKSKLGRKLAKQADEIKTLKEMNQSILSMLEKMTGTKKDAARDPEVEDEDLPDPDTTVITTGRDMLNFLGKLQKVTQTKQSVAAQKYQAGYVGTLEKIGETSDLDDATVKEVTDIASNQDMKNPHNKKQTGNPLIDARLNFNSALAAVMRMRLEGRGKGGDELNPLKGGKPKAPLGPSIKSRSSVGDLAIPDLDSDAKELVDYAKKTGIPITEDDIRDLRGPMPSYLGGRA